MHVSDAVLLGDIERLRSAVEGINDILNALVVSTGANTAPTTSSVSDKPRAQVTVGAGRSARQLPASAERSRRGSARQPTSFERDVSGAIHASPRVERRAYTISDVCEAVRVSRSTVYKLISSGRLRTVKVAGRRLITCEALEALLREGAA
jgi:excisionase family DNA binding protein